VWSYQAVAAEGQQYPQVLASGGARVAGRRRHDRRAEEGRAYFCGIVVESDHHGHASSLTKAEMELTDVSPPLRECSNDNLLLFLTKAGYNAG
jgi:hypothetical protein